MVVVALW